MSHSLLLREEQALVGQARELKGIRNRVRQIVSKSKIIQVLLVFLQYAVVSHSLFTPYTGN